jgi:hypothetical protein
MPTPLHNSVQRWLTTCASEWERNGIVTPDERDKIDGEYGTTIKLHCSPFAQSLKEPDILIDPFDGQHVPSVVVEAGWSESSTGLEANAELLIKSSGGLIRVAVLVEWRLSKEHQKVSGEASVWVLNGSDQLLRRQIEECERLDQY